MTTASPPSMAPVTTATKFEPVAYWAKLPMGVTFRGDATSVATDSDDNVYVFNRGSHPVAVFDSDGNFIEGWGQGEFDRPHGIAVDGDDNLYFVDDDGHFVQKRTREGQVLFTLGDRGNPAPWQGGGMFNRPTGVCINPANGDFFVSDGYGNSRVHKFDADGSHIKSWGEPGTGPGQFSLPHNIAMSGTDRVVVADRENFRVQVFTTDGEFVDQWHVHHPMSVCEGKGDDNSLYVGEMGPPPVQDGVPGLGLRVSIYNPDGDMINQFGKGTLGEAPDQFVAPHGISIDSEGSLYVAEVSWTAHFSKTGEPVPGEVVSLRKWRRADA